jgi:hypothetical protein
MMHTERATSKWTSIKGAVWAGSECLTMVLGAALLLGGCASMEQADSAQGTEVQAAVPEVQTAYGIRVEGLRLSAAGAMLDFRYRVLDASKAAPLLNGKIQPYLLDESRGAKLGVPDTPVLGRIRQTSRNNNIKENRTYFVMFGNPGKAVQSGDKVTLLLGEVKITDLTVQ